MFSSYSIYIARFARNYKSGTCPLPCGQKATIYNSRPQQNSSLSANVKRLVFKVVLWYVGGDICVVSLSVSKKASVMDA